MSTYSFSAYSMPMAPSIRISTTTNLGIYSVGLLSTQGRQHLAGDSVGVFTLTLQNLIVGSQWEIEILSAPGVSIKMGSAATSTVDITLSAYTTGNSNNSLKVKVRNSSASPYYQAFETQTTAVVGSLSIFINQVRDDI